MERKSLVPVKLMNMMPYFDVLLSLSSELPYERYSGTYLKDVLI